MHAVRPIALWYLPRSQSAQMNDESAALAPKPAAVSTMSTDARQ